MTSMPCEELETVYDNLASAIDQVGSDKEALLLTKLALVLANRIGDLDTFNDALRTALQDLDIEPQPLQTTTR